MSKLYNLRHAAGYVIKDRETKEYKAVICAWNGVRQVPVFTSYETDLDAAIGTLHAMADATDKVVAHV